VPRELYTCIGKGGVYEYLGLSAGAGIARGEQRQVYRCTTTGLVFHRECMDFKERMERLSAPSPAGVDGLEVRAYEDSGGALYTAKLLEIMEVDSVGCEPLCRLSDAQAIIDGLRGEVAELKHAASSELLSRLCQQLIDSGAENYQGSVFDLELGSELLTATVTLQYRGKPNAHDLRIAAETERDQHAHRIGELEGLLRHASKYIAPGAVLTLIKSTLSAGKDSAS
jgi:hypothetical protein